MGDNMNWPHDIYEMHTKFGVHDWVDNEVLRENKEKLYKFLEFRLNFLDEELLEARKGLATESPEDIVDAMIDLCVVAIGTLDAFGVDANDAWNKVHSANMSKQRGIKPGRPNPLGLPDLIKPDGWKSPDHSENHGFLPKVFDK